MTIEDGLATARFGVDRRVGLVDELVVEIVIGALVEPGRLEATVTQRNHGRRP